MPESENAENVRLEPKIDACIRRKFGAPAPDVRTCPPLTLAYIGDAVYDLVIRTLVVGAGKERVNRLHQHTSHLVKAASQSAMLEYMFPLMTEEELSVYRRGRNAHSATKAKNASVVEYRRATGFEAVLGYLYLTDRFDRLLELIQAGLDGFRSAEKARKKRKKP